MWLGSEVRDCWRWYREGSADAVAADDSSVSPGLSQPLRTRRLDEDHVRLQSGRPQHLDVLSRKQSVDTKNMLKQMSSNENI